MQGGNGKVVLGLGGYSTRVTQDTHHLEGRGGKRMLETWKIEDQSIDRVEGKYFFFFASIVPSQHFTVKMPIEIHHFNFEIGKGRNFPIFF